MPLVFRVEAFDSLFIEVELIPIHVRPRVLVTVSAKTDNQGIDPSRLIKEPWPGNDKMVILNLPPCQTVLTREPIDLQRTWLADFNKLFINSGGGDPPVEIKTLNLQE